MTTTTSPQDHSTWRTQRGEREKKIQINQTKEKTNEWNEMKRKTMQKSQRNGKWAPTINISYLIQIKSTPLPWTLFPANETTNGSRRETTITQRKKVYMKHSICKNASCIVAKSYKRQPKIQAERAFIVKLFETNCRTGGTYRSAYLFYCRFTGTQRAHKAKVAGCGCLFLRWFLSVALSIYIQFTNCIKVNCKV